MHNVLSEGNLVQFIATIKMEVPGNEWMKELKVSEFKEAFSGWPERLQNALAEVLGDQETIKCISHKEDLPARVYDEVRRPRTQRIVESSRGTGLVLTGCNPDYQMTVESLKGRLPQRWDLILECDNAKARDEALQLLERGI
ncbi:hypothetical protein CLAFUW4_10797 [Fulvia fulva]|uniref:Uncharacterized protein n=1 Tax=Passalora fulva TaxID=5499 RepID=A0A9Q8URL7_PASFU|nr:uncharacterized protein CLAFUR5_09840 [Fulvia fulva]KAK4619415.1 hypothetical protein CLAFUR4_10802 [Fulvia fulva]KAK4620752.1 hypothetical protein CLAFUR0_10809 [Fulvia fulva]UJO19883.1 hypothetical protein CLAFUR5_09840 [Fulvia fulva]WPV17146.1 hypothetical protein CLAFUW4_10797 [Fulvia fulva]WPV31799.1 hypothetical protein CLAFUW7_10795 [Fulvia fulva]